MDSQRDGGNCSRAEASIRAEETTSTCCGSKTDSPCGGQDSGSTVSTQSNHALGGKESSGEEHENQTISDCSNTASNSACCYVKAASAVSERTTKKRDGGCCSSKSETIVVRDKPTTRLANCSVSQQADACTGDSTDAGCQGGSCCDREETASKAVSEPPINTCCRNSVEGTAGCNSGTSCTEQLDGCCSKTINDFSSEECCKQGSTPCCDGR